LSPLFVDLLYGISAALLGAAGASWLWWSHVRRRAPVQGRAEAHRAVEVLDRLQELATRVAFDVDEHSSQVEEINDELAAAGPHESAMIVDVVAKLIQANEHMHQKLASTEDKLREQAVELQTHAAEARTDALTLLANRRAFDDEIARRAAEFARQGRTFSLIMADVDHFKKFNDAHGHQAGDEVLRGVAKLLRRKMREMDVVARYGGEEFAVILPGTNLEEACKAALRACAGLEAAHFRHEGRDLRVTASFGVAEVAPSCDAAALVGRADRALYAAKTGGRNCVWCQEGEEVRRVLPAPPPPPPEAPKPQAPPPPAAEQQAPSAGTAADAGTVPPKAGSPRSVELGGFSDLPSRTAFCQQVRNRTAEWKRGGRTFSVVLIEVNQYDEGETDHGLQVRAAVVQVVSEFLAATVREMDVVGNYAPGCFALLLPTAGLPDAIRVAERLRRSFGQHHGPLQSEPRRLTLSVGVVQVLGDDDSISVLKRAEAALDAADRRGGNCAYYHDGQRCVPISAMLETMDYLA
jgi:diguanylate cyclase